jgi:AcrR family transcriptional regulator
MTEKGKPRAAGDDRVPAGGARAVAQTAETRARLLEATTRLLGQRGIAGTSARDIARESGVNLAGIGYHFGSKESLVTEALLAAIRNWVEPALEILRRDMHPVERLMLAVQALQESFERGRDFVPVYLEALVEAPRNPTLREGVLELFRELHSFVSAQLREQRDSGFLPAWVDPDAMATLQLATVDGIALRAMLDPVDHRAVANQALMLLVAARGGGG